MAKYLLLYILLCFSTLHIAQTSTSKIQKQNTTSATFLGGKDSLKLYLSKTIEPKRPSGRPAHITASIEINAKGEITKVDIVKSTGLPLLDSLFIDAVKKMPKWIPAKNSSGNNCNDKQELHHDFRPKIGMLPAKN
jgi:hypothetical protein